MEVKREYTRRNSRNEKRDWEQNLEEKKGTCITIRIWRFVKPDGQALGHAVRGRQQL
jgi:hypothetical protein